MGRTIKFLGRLAENILFWIIITALSVVFAWITKDKIFLFFNIEIPVWLTIIFILFIVILIFLFFSYKKRKGSGSGILQFRMRNGREIKIPFTYNKINWIAFIPDQTFGEDEHVWLTGPFCPKCSLELKFKKKGKWYCERCNEYYNACKPKESESRSFIKKICYADFFRNKTFNKNES